jgi:parallel beta-helix repeat protein
LRDRLFIGEPSFKLSSKGESKVKKKLVSGIVVCMLLIGSMILPVAVTSSSKKVTQSLTMGTILYVGGSGSNNYTSINDAVDNASAGDTIFVYDDSSPYKENITISTSLTIQGENGHTTIIDGSHGDGHSFQINTDNVTITNFTIQNTAVAVYIGGIGGTASHNIVTNTIILNTSVGIAIYYGVPDESDFLPYGYNTIADNFIKNATYSAIAINQGQHNLITRNTVTETRGSDEYQYGWGIQITGAFNNISYNNISDNERFGIAIGYTYKTIIYRNNIEDNGLYGLVIECGSFDQILQNNFIGNRRSAVYDQEIKLSLLTHKGHYPVLPCIWKENYWNRPRLLPYIIPGFIGYMGYFSWAFYNKFDIIPPDSVRVDWQPAQEPYDI